MATKRQRANGTWEYTVRRKNLLPKPLYLSFESEAAGDKYVADLEKLLDRGIVPAGLVDETPERYTTLSEVIDDYKRLVHVPDSDLSQLLLVRGKYGGTRMAEINYGWAEAWVLKMKREENLAPSTIRHYVGSLARGFDWVLRKQPELLPGGNPLRLLPKRYASYNEDDKKALPKDTAPREDVWRDRRLGEGEEKWIRAIMDGVKPEGRQRPLKLEHKRSLQVLFELALESMMRMSEMYTLELTQISLESRTIFLDRTKNGDKRQVPMTSVVQQMLTGYVEEIGPNGFEGRLFPWWDGDRSPGNMRKTTSMLSKQFSRIFEAAGCPDLRFHDLRHEATSRMHERTTLSDMEICAIGGWKDPRMMKRYSNLRGSNLAAKLW